MCFLAKTDGRQNLVSSPDRHALMAKDGLEQLLQILGPSVKCLFHSKRRFIVTKVHFEWKRRLMMDQEFEATVPDRVSPVGRGGPGTRQGDHACHAHHMAVNVNVNVSILVNAGLYGKASPAKGQATPA